MTKTSVISPLYPPYSSPISRGEGVHLYKDVLVPRGEVAHAEDLVRVRVRVRVGTRVRAGVRVRARVRVRIGVRVRVKVRVS